MAVLFRMSLILCIATLFLISQCSCMQDVKTARAALPFGIEKLCSDTSIFLTNKKILCLICKGLDPTCWGATTTHATTTSGTTKPTQTPTTTTPKAEEGE